MSRQLAAASLKLSLEMENPPVVATGNKKKQNKEKKARNPVEKKRLKNKKAKDLTEGSLYFEIIFIVVGIYIFCILYSYHFIIFLS